MDQQQDKVDMEPPEDNVPPGSQNVNAVTNVIYKSRYILMSLVAVVGVGAFVIVASGDDQLGDVALGAEFEAESEQVFAVDASEESGFSYALGAPATDETNYDEFSIPVASEELRAELLEVFNESEAFAGVAHINELLEYDDFDQQGNIKEEVMRDLIEIGRAGL